MNKRFIVLSILLVLLLIATIFKYSLSYIYVNPLVNTQVLPYISDTIAPLDKVLNTTIKDCKKNHSDMRLEFQNAYGSGFLQGNSIPNDLDYSVGVYLGKFKYDGTNSKEIAIELVRRIQDFQVYLNSNIETDLTLNYYPEYSTMNYIAAFTKEHAFYVNNINKSLAYIWGDKDYVFYSNKYMANNITVYFPFVMKNNEILVENLKPLTYYSDRIKYSDSTTKFLRELSIIVDYSFDIENVETEQNRKVEIVAEAFTGQKMQISKRAFVPSVFLGQYSAKYLKNIAYLKDDELYLRHRILIFGRFLQVIKNIEVKNDQPVKLLKRYLQCLCIIKPLLDEDCYNEAYQFIVKELENENVKLLNDYSTVMSNLVRISHYPSLYNNALKNDQILEMLNVTNDAIYKLHKNKYLSDDDYNRMLKFNKLSIVNFYNVKTPEEMQVIAKWFTKYKTDEIEPIEIKTFNKILANNKNLEKYNKIFEQKYTEAGFHLVTLYWLDKNKIGIKKDSFTKNIKSNELHKMALENNLVDVEYVLVNEKDVDTYRVRYSMWIRYNPTKDQEKAYNEMKQILLKDKSKYKIKSKLVF